MLKPFRRLKKELFSVLSSDSSSQWFISVSNAVVLPKPRNQVFKKKRFKVHFDATGRRIKPPSAA
jgi:hypothetical protein